MELHANAMGEKGKEMEERLTTWLLLLCQMGFTSADESRLLYSSSFLSSIFYFDSFFYVQISVG